MNPFPLSFWKNTGFDPATLPLVLWVQDDGFPGTPGGTWVGTPSAGPSGVNPLTNGAGAQAMTVGAPINGRRTARCSGVGGAQQQNGGVFSTYIAPTWSAWVVANVASIPNNSLFYDGAQFIGNTFGEWGLYCRNTAPSFAQFSYDGVYEGPEIAMSTGGLALFQARSDGVSTTEIRINGGLWTSHSGIILSSNGNLRVGTNYNNAATLGADFAQFAMSKSRLSDSTFDGVLSYVRHRYAAPFA